VLFDTELCRMAAGWTGGFLDLKGVAFNTDHGPSPSVKGTQLFGTKIAPGWGSPEARVDDPRPRIKDQGADFPYGPLPRDWAKYKGLYVHGEQVVLSYPVGSAGVGVLEVPGVERIGDAVVITRTIKVAGHDRELLLRIAEVMGTDLSVKLAGVPSSMDAIIEGRDGALFLRLPARAEPTLLKLFIGLGVKGEAPNTPLIDPETLTKGGPARWAQPVETKGVLGEGNDAAYVVDTLAVPEKNPWNSWIRFGGLDFFDGGMTAALSTWSGDVWTCAGIDDKLEKLTWRRVASGLFQPLGLKIVDGKIYALGRDQITRLHDLNGDGEADFYENFNNDVAVTPAFHEFAFDLQTDPAGNVYFAKAGGVRAGGQGFEPRSPHNGCVLRVSKDGSKFDVFATGFRAPNGIGVSPAGQVTAGDNQGTWTPVCRLNWVKQGGFYGVVDLAHRDPPPTQTDNPLCWLPTSVDNSAGGQVWVTSDKWGPFAGHLLHTSYGQSALFKVLYEDAGGDVQGGVVRFGLKFESGVMRPRFNPADGQLYLCGMKGWQTNAAKDACFHRVRLTGTPANMPSAL
jgi:glucose/arabinose dehydrogenase